MVQIRYRSPDGREGVFEATAGRSLMASARAAGVPGIIAECGGSMVCGTCHVFIDEVWFARLPPVEAMEAELIDYGLHFRPTSRLSCQIMVTETMDGLSLEIPPSQR